MSNINMKIKNLVCSLLLIILFTPSALLAQVYYDEYGKIALINNVKISTNDGWIRLSPTVKVVLLNGKKGQLRDLQKGDYVRTTVLKIDKQHLVDTIYQLPDPNSTNIKQQ